MLSGDVPRTLAWNTTTSLQLANEMSKRLAMIEFLNIKCVFLGYRRKLLLPSVSQGSSQWGYSIIRSGSGITMNPNPKWIRLTLDTPKVIRFAKWIWTEIHCESWSGSDNQIALRYFHWTINAGRSNVGNPNVHPLVVSSVNFMSTMNDTEHFLMEIRQVLQPQQPHYLGASQYKLFSSINN